MNVKRKLVSAGALAAVTAATVGAMAAPAQAAAYNGVCGSGYRVIDKLELLRGTVYLTYNGGWNCVVTVADSGAHDSKPMAAFLKRSSDSEFVRDDDYYRYYAGPVYRYAPSQCIDWGGRIGLDSDSAWGDHCG
ncbi:spore-associated protein A [Actinomadura algeriensis]|uniref:Spore-associated protein A n=1 Tax=Actinomadura algeriensis TaxID=1679523 RepID=A0ABR9JQ15_9ACTN|nr:spore-associated protein A [Actinomadura algeriensis]MBE1532622.1 hypothetical protein [Actinomadura algeriensis]